VPVQGHLRHAGLRDDAVDPDRVDAVTAEQVIGGAESPLSWVGRRAGLG
jgi:hypothetical protein